MNLGKLRLLRFRKQTQTWNFCGIFVAAKRNLDFRRPQVRPGFHRFSDSGSHLEILCAERVTWSKFHFEDLEILGATVQHLVATAIWQPRFVDPWVRHLKVNEGRAGLKLRISCHSYPYLYVFIHEHIGTFAFNVLVYNFLIPVFLAGAVLTAEGPKICSVICFITTAQVAGLEPAVLLVCWSFELLGSSQ
jgi:hypothetical protein